MAVPEAYWKQLLNLIFCEKYHELTGKLFLEVSTFV